MKWASASGGRALNDLAEATTSMSPEELDAGGANHLHGVAYTTVALPTSAASHGPRRRDRRWKLHKFSAVCLRARIRIRRCSAFTSVLRGHRRSSTRSWLCRKRPLTRPSRSGKRARPALSSPTWWGLTALDVRGNRFARAPEPGLSPACVRRTATRTSPSRHRIAKRSSTRPPGIGPNTRKTCSRSRRESASVLR